MDKGSRRPTTEVSSRRPGATINALAVVLAVSLAGVGCGGQSASTDPLASIARSVADDERTPAAPAESWRRAPDPALTLRPAVGENNVYLALGNSLVAWAASNGDSLWEQSLDSEISTAPVALGAQVVVASRGNAAVPPRIWWITNDGRNAAQQQVDRPILEISAIPGTVAYVDTTGVGRLGGGIEWHQPLEGAQTVVLTADRRLVLATTASGSLMAFDATSGARRWEYHHGGAITRAALSDTHAYVGSADGNVIAFRVDSGREAWRRTLGTGVVGSPTPTDKIVWVAGFDAVLRAINAGNGTELFTMPLSSRNYLNMTNFGPWAVIGARYGPWLVVRGPMTGDERARLRPQPVQVRVNQPPTDQPDLTVTAGSGPAGIAVVLGNGTLVFLEPRRAR